MNSARRQKRRQKRIEKTKRLEGGLKTVNTKLKAIKYTPKN